MGTSKDFWEEVRRRKEYYFGFSNKEKHRWKPGMNFGVIEGLNAPIAPPQPKKSISPQQKDKKHKFLAKQEGKCAYCGELFSAKLIATFDHIKPKSKGGRNSLNNLVLACYPCNQLKGNLSTYEEAKKRAEIYLSFAEMLKSKGYLE